MTLIQIKKEQHRTVLLLAFMSLAFCLTLKGMEAKDIVMILGSVGTPLGVYLGIKGANPENKDNTNV